MKKEIIFLKPAFVPKIWGSQKMEQLFKFDLPKNLPIGEAWLVSAHPNGMSYVLNGEFQGYSLQELYEKQPQLFSFPKSKEFPLLTKILDATDNLSVQIHPDDAFAHTHHQSLGKTECWYVLDCLPKQEVILGHKAKTQQQLLEWIDNNKFNKLLNYQKIKRDEFIYVPSLKIHGLLAGTVVYELQQSSDITYRLYDYDRLDNQGNPRKLHLDEAKQIIIVPDHDISNANAHDNYLVDNQFFKLIKLTNTEEKTYNYPQTPWLQATVIKGAGTIDNQPLKVGQSFILPAGYNTFTLNGEMTIMLSYAD